MRTCVTGAAGFVGRALCTALAHHTEVIAIVRAATEGPWSRSSVTDLTRAAPPEGVLADVEVVYHLAARTHALDEIGDHYDDYAAINIEGTRRMLEAARAAGVRSFIYFSSVKAVGEGGATALNDQTAPVPTSAYGKTKLVAEQMVCEGGYVPHPVVLRLTPVYGPGSRGNIVRMIAAVKAGRFPPVPDTGNRRSMVHVDDVVQAARVVAARNEAGGRAFFVSDGEYYSTRRLYELICDYLNKKPGRGWPESFFRALALAGSLVGGATRRRAPFDRDAYQKLFGSSFCEIEELKALGYAPTWTLDRALPEMVEG